MSLFVYIDVCMYVSTTNCSIMLMDFLFFIFFQFKLKLNKYKINKQNNKKEKKFVKLRN